MAVKNTIHRRAFFIDPDGEDTSYEDRDEQRQFMICPAQKGHLETEKELLRRAFITVLESMGVDESTRITEWSGVLEVIGEGMQNAIGHGNKRNATRPAMLDWTIREHDDPKNNDLIMDIGDTGKGFETRIDEKQAYELNYVQGEEGRFGLIMMTGYSDTIDTLTDVPVEWDGRNVPMFIVRSTRRLLKITADRKSPTTTPECTKADCA